MRWYKFGPEIVPPQEPVRVIEWDVDGTASGSALPPQVAVSVTEMTSSRRAWGRFYLPFNALANTDAQGRIATASLTLIADKLDAMYETCLAAGLIPVVYSPAKPERETAGGGTLPAIEARALTVDKLQVDDVFDVIRSRRWKAPLLKVQRAIGS
jgi:hypothetical protein